LLLSNADDFGSGRCAPAFYFERSQQNAMSLGRPQVFRMTPSQTFGIIAGTVLLLPALVGKLPTDSLASLQLRRVGFVLCAAGFAISPFVSSVPWLKDALILCALGAFVASFAKRNRALAA
jgi:hypothetical protein